MAVGQGGEESYAFNMQLRAPAEHKGEDKDAVTRGESGRGERGVLRQVQALN